MEIKGYVSRIIINGPKLFVFSINNKIRVKYEKPLKIELKEKMNLKILGDFSTDKYGKIFIAENLSEVVFKENMLPFFIKGIGDKKSKEIEEILGDDYLNILINEPIKIYDFFLNETTKKILPQWLAIKDSLPEKDKVKYISKNIKGIGPKRVLEFLEFCKDDLSLESFYKFFASDVSSDIYEQAKNLEELNRIYIKLKKIGINRFCLLNLIDEQKINSYDYLKNDPYILFDMGMDFLDVDEIALNYFNEDIESHRRIIHATEYVLKFNESEGNTFLDIEEAINQVRDIIQIDRQVIGDIIHITASIDGSEFILKDNNLYRRVIYFTERKISLMIKEKLSMNKNIISDKAENFLSTSILSDEQKEAVKGLIKERFSILSGGPGTGKTTTINDLCKALELSNKSFMLCAPTGRASKRMTESTGKESKTIHRLLEYKPMGLIGRFLRNENYQIYTDYLILDEASMLDIYLMNSLLKALSSKTSIILVGDVNQLPSISAGSILKDLKDSGIVPVFELKQIFRQKKESFIIKNAYNINENKEIEVKGDDFSFFELNSLSQILEVIQKKLNKDSFQILCPTKIGQYGTEFFNEYIQNLINPSEIKIFANNKFFKLGDRVIELENDYNKEIYNGEIGIIKEIHDDYIKVYYENNYPNIIEYNKKEMRKIDLAYAITIHKSQGSEFDNLFLILYGNSDFISKELVYTGVTRAKKDLNVLSLLSKEDIKNLKSSNNRSTNLKELLIN